MHTKTIRPAGDRAARQAISVQQEPCLNSPNADQKQAPRTAIEAAYRAALERRGRP